MFPNALTQKVPCCEWAGASIRDTPPSVKEVRVEKHCSDRLSSQWMKYSAALKPAGLFGKILIHGGGLGWKVFFGWSSADTALNIK